MGFICLVLRTCIWIWYEFFQLIWAILSVHQCHYCCSWRGTWSPEVQSYCCVHNHIPVVERGSQPEHLRVDNYSIPAGYRLTTKAFSWKTCKNKFHFLGGNFVYVFPYFLYVAILLYSYSATYVTYLITVKMFCSIFSFQCFVCLMHTTFTNKSKTVCACLSHTQWCETVCVHTTHCHCWIVPVLFHSWCKFFISVYSSCLPLMPAFETTLIKLTSISGSSFMELLSHLWSVNCVIVIYLLNTTFNLSHFYIICFTWLKI